MATTRIRREVSTQDRNDRCPCSPMPPNSRSRFSMTMTRRESPSASTISPSRTVSSLRRRCSRALATTPSSRPSRSTMLSNMSENEVMPITSSGSRAMRSRPARSASWASRCRATSMTCDFPEPLGPTRRVCCSVPTVPATWKRWSRLARTGSRPTVRASRSPPCSRWGVYGFGVARTGRLPVPVEPAEMAPVPADQARLELVGAVGVAPEVVVPLQQLDQAHQLAAYSSRMSSTSGASSP